MTLLEQKQRFRALLPFSQRNCCAGCWSSASSISVHYRPTKNTDNCHLSEKFGRKLQFQPAWLSSLALCWLIGSNMSRSNLLPWLTDYQTATLLLMVRPLVSWHCHGRARIFINLSPWSDCPIWELSFQEHLFKKNTQSPYWQTEVLPEGLDFEIAVLWCS